MSSLLSNAAGYAAAFGDLDVTSDPMRRAIEFWFDLYYLDMPTEEADPCQRIPYTVVTKITRAVFSEYTAKTEDTFAQMLLQELDKMANTAMQIALIGGEALIKPVIDAVSKQIMFGVIPRNNILVFARDAHGNMTDIGTTEHSTAGNCYYTLMERRTVDGKGYLTIQNKLFQSYSKDNFGQQVPLSKLPQYAELPEKYTFVKPVNSVGLINLRTPMVNCVDGSADGVSVYAAAVGLIRNINRNEAQLNGEFDRAESRIVVSADMMQKDVHGNKTLKDKIFVGLDEDPETIGVNMFSPALREASFLARKQEYLRNVENVIGMKRGLLSEVEAAERTATEITSSAGEYNLTIIDLQKEWEKAVRETMRVCSILGQLYQVANAKDIADDAVIIDWGNGVLYDENKTWEDYKNMVAAGLLAPEVALGWRFGLPSETPEERAIIRTKYMPDAESLLEG